MSFASKVADRFDPSTLMATDVAEAITSISSRAIEMVPDSRRDDAGCRDQPLTGFALVKPNGARRHPFRHMPAFRQ